MGIDNKIILLHKLYSDLNEFKDKIVIEDLSGMDYYREGGGKLKYVSSDLSVFTSFNFGEIYESITQDFTITSIGEKMGQPLSKFLNKLFSEDISKYIWIRNYQVFDIRKNIINKKRLQIINSVIDDLTLRILKKFHKMEEITFLNCQIKKECNFNILENIKIIIAESTVEDFRVFNDSKINLEISSSNIDNIKPGNFLGEKLDLIYSNIDTYKLFLVWNMPDLKNLSIYDNKIENNLKYLGDSAPNIEKLNIESKITSFEFLYKLVKLIDAWIAGEIGDMSEPIYKISNNEEIEKYKKRYKKELEIAKILDNKLDESQFVMREAFRKFVKNCDTYRKLHFTEKEKEALITSFQKGFYQYVMSDEFVNFEDGYYTALGSNITFNAKDSRSRYGVDSKINMVGNFLVSEESTKYLRKSNIINAVPYMYYIDGHPIELIYRKEKSIKSIEEALNISSKVTDSNYDVIENILLNIAKVSDIDGLTFANLLSILENYEGIRVYNSKFLSDVKEKIKEFNENEFDYLIKYIDSYIESKELKKEYEEQYRNRFNDLMILLLNHYDKFGIQEKLYLYNSLDNYLIMSNIIIGQKRSFNMGDVISIEESNPKIINKLTNGIYSKTYNEVIELSQIFLNLEPKYNKMTEEEIKQLKYIKSK